MITEEVLKEKESQLKAIQKKINVLMNDDIPDEEHPEIKALQKQVTDGFMVLEDMRQNLLMSDAELEGAEPELAEEVSKDISRINEIQKQIELLKQKLSK